MKIAVASRNPVKVAATEAAFSALFPGADLEMVAVAVDSGVADQPSSDQETRLGALTRAARAGALVEVFDYAVGLEGGVELIGGRLLAFAWMAVRDRSGRIGEARSVTLPLPDSIRDLVAAGMELGEANDAIFATVNSKQAGGAYGLLTNGRITRESVYRETLILALTPFVHPLFTAERAKDPPNVP